MIGAGNRGDNTGNGNGAKWRCEKMLAALTVRGEGGSGG